MIIRPVARADFDAWKVLWDGYNAFYGREGPTALPDAVTRATWSRFFDDNEPVHGLVAVDGERVLGLAHYLFHRSTTQLNLVCFLQDIFSVVESRGKGVGRALIEAVYAKAREAGAKRVYWQTHETNATAMRLYNQVAERSGFIVYRRDVG